MAMTQQVVGITGATGYLGSILLKHFTSQGWRTVALSRSRPFGQSSEWRHYDIDAPVSAELVDGLDALVHCAYDMRARTISSIWGTNVDGTRRLLAEAKGSVGRIVVLSSMSAFDGTTQLYGRAKLDIERHASMAGALVARPGLVYGPDYGGMVGALSRLVRLRLVPVPSRECRQFMIQDEDFVRAVQMLVESSIMPLGPIGLANPEPVSFNHILHVLAEAQGVSCTLLPVPWRLLQLPLQAAEKVGLPLPMRSDSLLGLITSAPCVPNVEVVQDQLGVPLRAFDVDGLSHSR
jgi:nucleoside-diphosphate-sugar epimerase